MRAAGRKLSVRLYPEHIEARDEETIAAVHARSFERGEVCHDWQHYIGLVEKKPGALCDGAPFEGLPALQRLRSALMRRAGGDRVLAEVLACVPRHGLETVPVAAELVLESGNTSAEHVKNVPSRLQQTSAPTTVETALRLTEASIADAGRYDRLRKEADHA